MCGLSNALDGTENNLIRCAKEIPEFNIPYGVSAEESDEDIFADKDEQEEEDDEQDEEDKHYDEKEYKEDEQHEEDDEENDCEYAYVHLRWVIIVLSSYTLCLLFNTVAIKLYNQCMQNGDSERSSSVSECVSAFHCMLIHKESPFHLSDVNIVSCWLPCR